MSGILFNAGVDPERDEKARRAVKAFRSMQPTLTAYARMVTKRRDVRVELATSSTPSTDDKRIFYRPPIDMGDNTPHERRLCDKRDENLQSLCKACLVREQVLVNIFHEIGHIAKGSFQEPSASEVQTAMEAALAEVPKAYADRVRAKFDAAPPFVKRHLTGLASLVNEYLPFMVNALEDARVDREMFKARKGLKVMFDADVWRIFNQGMEGTNGEFHSWKDQPQNNQVMVGAYAKAAGYDVTGWFIPPVEEALADDALTTLLRRIDTVRSASGTYQLGFAVLSRLRELGFCGTPNDPDPEPEPEPDEPEAGDETSNEQEPQPEEGDESNDGEPESGPESSGGEGSDESDVEPETDEGEGGSDRELSEDEGDNGSDDGTGSDSPDGQPSDQAGTDGDLSDERSEAPSESESEASDGDSSDGSSTPERERDSGTGSRDEDEGEAGSDDVPDEASPDAADENTSGGSSEASDSDQSESGSELPSGDDGDSDSKEGQGGGTASPDETADDAESGERTPDTGSGTDPDGDEPSESELDPSTPDDSDGPRDSDLDSERDGEALGDSEGRDPEPQESAGPDMEEPRTDPGEPDSTDAPVDESLIDTGADEGRGGIEIIEKEEFDHIPMGTSEDLMAALNVFHAPEDHDGDLPKTVEEAANEEAVDRAIVQGMYFETPSRNIYGVREHHFGEPIMVKNQNMSSAWDPNNILSSLIRTRIGRDGEFDPEEKILGPALLEMRVAFADNQRGAELRHRKSGKVDGRVLGKRAHFGDERLFKKKYLPGRKDYFVLLGMDVSGSTIGRNIFLEKKAVMAQAELLDRMGIKFAIYAHTGDYHDPFAGRDGGMDLDIYHIKDTDEPWDTERKKRLIEIGPSSANLDGHTLEFYRKTLDAHSATDKILLYYSDGKMPAENHDEELDILQREILTCRNKGYVLLGVGIRTDSPVRHGLDTVQVDEDADIVKVVRHLESRLI